MTQPPFLIFQLDTDESLSKPTDSSMNFQGLFGFVIFFLPIFVIKGVPGDSACQGLFRGIPGCPQGVSGLFLNLQSPGREIRLV